MRRYAVWIALTAIGAATAVAQMPTPVAPQKPSSAKPITVTSTTFQAGGALPMKTVFNSFGCTGGNASPQLAWSGFPAETKSFAVTLWDPDAPTGIGYVHWLVFNIPADVTSLSENAGATATPGGGVTGYSDFGSHAYGGPCPPPGDKPHRYIFTVSALDVPALNGAGPGTTLATLTFLMRGHLLAQGQLEGRFGRP
jgi:Raf kinase inhibitor-like YbhB/YbcL family protein